jgi:hypothetical protein
MSACPRLGKASARSNQAVLTADLTGITAGLRRPAIRSSARSGAVLPVTTTTVAAAMTAAAMTTPSAVTLVIIVAAWEQNRAYAGNRLGPRLGQQGRRPGSPWSLPPARSLQVP